MQNAVEGCRHHAVADLDLDARHGRPSGFEVRERFGDVGLRLEILGLEAFRRLVLNPSLVHERPGLLQARLAVAHVQAHDHFALLHPRTARGADGYHAPVDLGAQGDIASGFSLAVNDHVPGHRLGLQDAHPHAGDRGSIDARPFEGRVSRGAGGPRSRQQPHGQRRGDAECDRERLIAFQKALHVGFLLPEWPQPTLESGTSSACADSSQRSRFSRM